MKPWTTIYRGGWAGRAAIVGLASFLLSGCGTPGWTMMVENSGGERRIVRVSNADSSVDREVAGLSSEWVVISEAALMGPVSILDPETCEVLATVAQIPDYHTVLVIGPDDKIFLGEAGPGTLPDQNDVAPTSADCPPAP